MTIDVADLRDFYATPLGLVVRRTLGHKIRQRWSNTTGATVVGLGFASPYLGVFRTEAARVGALMPSNQGALVWPRTGRTMCVLVDEAQLPLPDNSVDRLLAVHCLEGAAAVPTLLREVWRVLAPDGRLLLVVSNRRGLWARFDTTPFGQGRPYSWGQVQTLLQEAMLTPTDWATALHMPPVQKRFVLRAAKAWETSGAKVGRSFGGVLVVEARKELMAPIVRGAPARKVLELQPAGRAHFERTHG